MSKMDGLVLRVSGENRTSFIVAIVLVLIFSIGMAVLAALYLLNRRKLAEANSRIRMAEEKARQLEEKARLEQEEEKRRDLDRQAQESRARIQQQKEKMAAIEKKRQDFDGLLDRIKSWQDLEVTGP